MSTIIHPVEAVIFDMDGLMIDSEKWWHVGQSYIQ